MTAEPRLASYARSIVYQSLLLVLCLLIWTPRSISQESSAVMDSLREQARIAIEANDLKALQASLSNLPVNERLAYLDSMIELLNQSRRQITGHPSKASGIAQSQQVVGAQLSGSRTSSASGQSSSESSQGFPGSDSPESPAGGQGGVTRADFTELIQLIRNTIAGRWDDQTDTIEPFPSGVWIDPSGSLKYASSSAKRSKIGEVQKLAPIVLPGLGAFQEWNELRWVSLHALDQELASRRAADRPTSVSMEFLGGLSRIDAVAFDSESREWFIGGPAGGLVLSPLGELMCSKTKLPPVLLEDLLCLAPHVLNNRGVLGCSIDPVAQNLGEAINFINDPTTPKQLARDPKGWTKKLLEIIGPQEVQILGLPSDSPSGTAMLIADHHLKRLGLGLELGPKGLNDYFAEASHLGSVPAQGLIRWWFTINPGVIETDADQTLFVLPRDPVRLLSEQQWSDQQGNRQASGQQDLAADRFAANFTRRFDQVAEMYPIYGRLRHIFSLAIALEIVRRESVEKDSLPFRMLNDTVIAPRLSTPPKSIDPVSTTRVLPDRRVVAVVSGGVKLDLAKTGEAQRTRNNLRNDWKLPTGNATSPEHWWR